MHGPAHGPFVHVWYNIQICNIPLTLWLCKPSHDPPPALPILHLTTLRCLTRLRSPVKGLSPAGTIPNSKGNGQLGWRLSQGKPTKGWPQWHYSLSHTTIACTYNMSLSQYNIRSQWPHHVHCEKKLSENRSTIRTYPDHPHITISR